MQKPSDYSCCHADELFPTLLPGMYTYVPPCEHAHFVAILSWRPQYDFPKTTGGQRAYGLFRKFIRFENMGFPLFIYWIKATIHHQAFCLILVSGLSHQSKTLFSLNQSDVSPLMHQLITEDISYIEKLFICFAPDFEICVCWTPALWARVAEPFSQRACLQHFRDLFRWKPKSWLQGWVNCVSSGHSRLHTRSCTHCSERAFLQCEWAYAVSGYLLV